MNQTYFVPALDSQHVSSGLQAWNAHVFLLAHQIETNILQTVVNYAYGKVDVVAFSDIVDRSGSFNAVSVSSTFTVSCIVSRSGATYQMQNGTTGQVGFQSTNFSLIMNTAAGNLTQGGDIGMRAGNCTVTNTITIGALGRC